MKCAKITTALERAEFKHTTQIVGSDMANEAYFENNNYPMSKTSTGKPSAVYTRVKKQLGENKAIEVKAKTFTQSFKDIYGDWTTVQDEPTLDDRFIFDGLNGEIPIRDKGIPFTPTNTTKPYFSKNALHTTAKHNTKLATKLISLFANSGVEVTVVFDEKLIERGSVETIDGKHVIKINPLLMTSDTLYHEFGHLYVDLITDQNYIDFAVNQLKGTKLWVDIAKANTHLSPHLLGREVLVSAIGVKASDLFIGQGAQTTWEFIVNRIKMLFNRVFNDKLPADTVTEIANTLVNKDVIKNLDALKTVELQHQQGTARAEALNVYGTLLHEIKNDMVTTKRAFKNNISFAQYAPNITKATSNINEMVVNAKTVDLINVIDSTRQNIIIINDLLNNITGDLLNINKDFDSRHFLFSDITPGEFNNINDVLYLARHIIKIGTNVVGFKGKHMKPDKNSLTKTEYDLIVNLNLDIDKALNDKVINGQTIEVGIREKLNLLDHMHGKLLDRSKAYIMSLSTDPDNDASMEEQDFLSQFNDTLTEETLVNRLLDSAYDSPNKYVALTIKSLRLTYGRRDLEIASRQRKFREMFNVMSKDDIAKVIDNGRIVQEYDYDRFYDDINAKYDTMTGGKKNKPNIYTTILDNLTYNPKKIEGLDNEASIKQVIEHNKLNMKPTEFNRWYSDNLYVNNKGIIQPTLFGEFKVPQDKYVDSKYLAIKENSNLAEFHEYLTNEFKSLTNHIANSPQRLGFLPAISTKPRKAQEEFSTQVVKNNDVDGNTYRSIPFNFIGYLNAKANIYIEAKYDSETSEQHEARVLDVINAQYTIKDDNGKRKTFTSIKEVREYNKAISKQNRSEHNVNLNTDLAFVVPLFIESAISNKYKNEAKSSVLNALLNAKTMNVAERNFGDKVITNETNMSKKSKRYMSAEQNAYNHLLKTIEMDFFEHTVNKDTKFQRRTAKLTGKLRNYSSLLGMGLNAHAAVKNVQYGNNMLVIEAMAGQYINLKDLTVGGVQYTKNLVSFVTDVVSGKDYFSSSKESGIMSQFGVIENISDLLEKENPSLHSNRPKQLITEVAYFGQSAGEHAMHNTMLFAMLNSHRLVDGKIVSLHDLEARALRGIKGKMSKEEFSKLKKDRSAIKSKLKAKFEAAPKLYDLIELAKDKQGNNLGYTRFKEGTNISDNEFIEFKERIKGVNHKLHGIYNKIDKGNIEFYNLGKLAMQYHHWMRAGWTKRYAGLNDFVLSRERNVWNERRKEENIGGYVSLLKFITAPFRGEYGNSINESADVDMKAALTKMMDMTMRLFQLSRAWNTLNAYEKSGAKRTLAEVGAVLTFISLAAARYDDDDDKKKPNTAATVFEDFIDLQVNAAQQELTTYLLPHMEYKKFQQNIIPPEQVLSNMALLMWQLTTMPFKTDNQNIKQGGVNYGQYEAVVTAKKLTPFLNQYVRWKHMRNTVSTYKLYKPIISFDKSPNGKSKGKGKSKKRKDMTMSGSKTTNKGGSTFNM